MIIETERLYLMPLKAYQLKLWIEDISALEREINCTYRGEPLEEHFLDIIKGQYKKTAGDEDNYLYYSFWLIVRKEDRIVVGSADFKDLPDSNSEIEIGYGLGSEFEHNGYMTEAAKAMCEWAMKQEQVSHVIAETYSDNIQSQRVLERCGFKQFKNADNSIWWRF